MEFRKELNIPASDIALGLHDGITLTGSCFAENIGNLLQAHQFPVHCNSHGILYNPHSIRRSLEDVLNKRKYTEDDLVYHDSKFVSLNHHGRFSASTSEEALLNINESIDAAHTHLQSSKVLIITWGSAHAWKFQPNGEVVANCHRIPQQQFSKVLIEHTAIESLYTSLFEKLRLANPKLKIILTVSPVRYYRDGIVENNISKSHLLIAAHVLSKISGVYYFPAYEWIIDDLRDYRFFKEDMTHPGEQAIRYVWEKFLHWSMHPDMISKVMRIGELIKSLHHRNQMNQSIDERNRMNAIRGEIEKITQK